VSFPSVEGNKISSKLPVHEASVHEKTSQDGTVSARVSQARNPERYAGEAKTPATTDHVLRVQDCFFSTSLVPV